MDSAREAKLREGGLLYRAEAAEVWAELDAARAEIERLQAALAKVGQVTPCSNCDGSGITERDSACCRIPGHARECKCLICEWKRAYYSVKNRWIADKTEIERLRKERDSARQEHLRGARTIQSAARDAAKIPAVLLFGDRA